MTVQFLKNPDHLHWGFEASYLGEDEWGDWMAVPAGSRRWKGDQAMHPTSFDAVFCAPKNAWWHLHYEGMLARTYQAFVDITTPVQWIDEHRYEMVALDLDVALHHDGTNAFVTTGAGDLILSPSGGNVLPSGVTNNVAFGRTQVREIA